MILNFLDLEFIEKTNVENMRGGNGIITLYKAKEKTSNVKILMKAIIPKGASIGYHQHLDDSEIIYILDGVATIIDNDKTFNVEKNNLHICFKNNFHSVINNADEDLVVLAIIVKEE